MSTLQEQLDRLIKRKGEQDPLVQALRNQIQAEKSGKSFQELCLTGSVKSWPDRGEPDYVLDLLKQFNLPVTRENYLELAYPEGVPEDLDETTLPEQIRLARAQDTLALFRELSKVTLPIDPSEAPARSEGH